MPSFDFRHRLLRLRKLSSFIPLMMLIDSSAGIVCLAEPQLMDGTLQVRAAKPEAPDNTLQSASGARFGPRRTIVLWAWQRAEDLSFLDPARFEVAYLACNVLLSGDRVIENWRQQSLNVPASMSMIGVIRVDSDRKRPPNLTSEQIEQVVEAVRILSRRPRTKVVQIDFDAVPTERAFYRDLLERCRRAMPGDRKLSITALASWCLFDNWISNLPVDETVPMMFSLGDDRSKLQRYFSQGGDFMTEKSKETLGISLEDPVTNQLMIQLIGRRKIPVRIYLFTRTAWTRDKVKAACSIVDGS